MFSDRHSSREDNFRVEIVSDGDVAPHERVLAEFVDAEFYCDQRRLQTKVKK